MIVRCSLPGLPLLGGFWGGSSGCSRSHCSLLAHVCVLLDSYLLVYQILQTRPSSTAAVSYGRIDLQGSIE